jgi:hypothetical protein
VKNAELAALGFVVARSMELRGAVEAAGLRQMARRLALVPSERFRALARAAARLSRRREQDGRGSGVEEDAARLRRTDDLPPLLTPAPLPDPYPPPPAPKPAVARSASGAPERLHPVLLSEDGRPVP